MDTIGTSKHIKAPSVEIAIKLNILTNELIRKNKFIEKHGIYQQDDRNYDPKWKEQIEVQIATLEKEYLEAIEKEK
jgi:hypothetical protein